MKYLPIIGLEVHVELKTKSKMFCGCSADYFGNQPNTHTCPVCLGLPGALPVPNKKAIEWCMMIGAALNCELPLHAKFDRKNYFYPDLAKGYQISQYDEPFAINGHMKLSSGNTIRIRRVHMEEDTGKLTHAEVDGERVTLVDFNRSGVPLVEIVTEPDFHDAKDVKEYLQNLQQIVRYLQVSNADMEKGDMRLEPNISLQKEGEKELPNYKVEVKNINSFRFVEKAIEYEIKRQTELLDTGERPAQETRGWNETKQKTISQREKEEANDYRYFPEPDIPPLDFEQSYIDKLKAEMPELPDKKRERFQKDYGLSAYDAEILTREIETAGYFENAVKHANRLNIGVSPKHIANYIINKKTDITTETPEELVKRIYAEITPSDFIDDNKLDEVIQNVLTQKTQTVQDYNNGKDAAKNVLLGEVMKQFKTKVDAKIVLERIIKAING